MCSERREHHVANARSNPEYPHQRKHAFDLGEYGAGFMTNSLTLGCDCKGSIHYIDANFVNRAGKAETIKNAICIHEEDAGILFKHTDFRDDSCTVTRARKLIISQVFTAANYEVIPSSACQGVQFANHHSIAYTGSYTRMAPSNSRSS